MSTEQTVANIDAAHRYAQQQADPGPRPDYPTVDKNTGTAITMPTPSLDPRIISAIEGYNDATAPYVQPAFDAFDTCHKGIQHVCDARMEVAKNTVWSEERRLLKIAELADKRQEAAAKAFDSARKRLEQGIAALEESLNKPLMQDSNAGSINGEVREYMRTATAEQRHKLLDAGDHTTLRAVLSAPGYLSGITEDERKLRTAMFHRTTQPEVAQRADVMKKALELIHTRSGLLFEQFERALAGKGAWQKVAVARKRAKAAEDALRIA